MNDNFNYEEQIVEEAQDTGATEKKGGEKVLKIVLGAVIVALVVVVVLVSLLLGTGSGKEEETTVLPEETTIGAVTEENTTSAAEKYKAGQYTVNVGENGRLNLRKEALKDAEQLITVPNGQLITVSEVIYDAAAEEGSQYWGKTSYLGWEGYVSMVYLANAYSESIVTPAEQTTAAEATTASAEATTAASTEVTTAASTETTTRKPVEQTSETTTAKTTETTTASSTSTGATAPGTYTVDAQPYLNMRDDHNVGALAIVQVPDKETVTVVEVYHDANSTDKYTKYWGKITYAGYTGWVAMGYLE